MRLPPPGIALLSALALGSCSSEGPRPDLGSIYSELASHHHEDQNPIVVVPGILGSKLVAGSDSQVVWGAFGGDAADPQSPAGARLIALPLDPTTPIAELADEVRPAGVLDRVQVHVLGLSFELEAYANILAALGVGGYRDESLGRAGAVDYGEEHYTCFQFAYDWRRDIAASAAQLHAFLLAKRAYVHRERQRRRPPAERGRHREEKIRFDVVAHSLGGLVLRYYLRYGAADLPAGGGEPPLSWAGAALVQRAILIAPPNGGSLRALERLVSGADFSALVPAYPAAVIGTMPAMYQLLPRGRHDALRLVGAQPERTGDPRDPALWRTLGWGLDAERADRVLTWLLPAAGGRAERRRIARTQLDRLLLRSRRMARALDVPATPPPGLELVLFAGDAIPTPARARALLDGSLEMSLYEPGDGTVTRASALLDERKRSERNLALRSPIAWRQVTFLFSDHLGLSADPAFTDNMLYLLLEAPR